VTITASSSAALAAGLRPLTADEHARLDWLRQQLRASGAQVGDAAALGALVDASHAGWTRSGSATVPDGMVAALAVGLGDVLVARARGASWVLRTVEGSSGPAVVDATGQAVVLPFEDLRARWVEGRVAWVPGYVDAASAHLQPTEPTAPAEPAALIASAAPTAPTAPRVPQPHARPVDERTPTAPAAPAAAAAESTPAPLTPVTAWQPAPDLRPAALPRRTGPSELAPNLVAPGEPAPSAPAPSEPAPGLVASGLVASGEPGPGLLAPGPLAPDLLVPAALRPASAAGPEPAAVAVIPPTPTAPGGAARPERPADLPEPPSAVVQDLVLRALEEALEVAMVGGDALPLAVVPADDRWQVRRFPGSTADDVRGWLASSGASRAALAWVDQLDGGAAVVAEASDAGRPGLVVGHRFVARDAPVQQRRHARPQVAEPVGELVLLGQSPPLV
jgi:hypothetical protein